MMNLQEQMKFLQKIRNSNNVSDNEKLKIMRDTLLKLKNNNFLNKKFGSEIDNLIIECEKLPLNSTNQ